VFDLLKPKHKDFDRDVLEEIAYLRALHGEKAYEVALERAARPRLRGERRRVIEAAAKRLAPDKRDIKSRS
jgi:hypothetical protein